MRGRRRRALVAVGADAKRESGSFIRHRIVSCFLNKEYVGKMYPLGYYELGWMYVYDERYCNIYLDTFFDFLC